MYLLVAATPFELDPVARELAAQPDVDFLLSGVGPVDAAFALTRYLCVHEKVSAVINFGVAGAYPGSGPGVLDLCVAHSEVLADLGICFFDRIEPFAGNIIEVNRQFDLHNGLFDRSLAMLDRENIAAIAGRFLTVNCVSGTTARGAHLSGTHQAMCENMEGAALARVCEGFKLDFFELRCVSNMVEDRDPSAWRLREACALAASAVSRLVRRLAGDSGLAE